MFHNLVEEAPDPLALLHPLDASGRLVFANEAFTRLLHHQPEALVGKCVGSCWLACAECVCVDTDHPHPFSRAHLHTSTPDSHSNLQSLIQ